MTQSIELDVFSPHVGEAFTLASSQDSQKTLLLLEARPLPEGTGPREAPFSLLFRASPDCGLWQGMATLRHTATGPLDLFLVPIGQDEAGLLFEAVFN